MKRIAVMSAALVTNPHLAPVFGSSLLSLIGNTPLLRIESLSTPKIAICAKAEFRNPGGSVKDRPALNMILEGERERRADPRTRPSSTPPAATPASPTP